MTEEEGTRPINEDEQEELEEDATILAAAAAGADMAAKPTQEILERCRNATLAELAQIDTEQVEKGMNLFFQNAYVEAEQIFKKGQSSDPLVANSLAVLYTIRALLSVEQQYINQACAFLLYASHFARDVQPPKKGLMSSAIAGVGGWFSRAPKEVKTAMSAATFRAKIVMAEAEVLRGIVLILEDSFTAYLKAGLALRRAYNIYDSLQKHLDEMKQINIASGKLTRKSAEDEAAEVAANMRRLDNVHELVNATGPRLGDAGYTPKGVLLYGVEIDDNSLYGMHFGLGCIHIATSILPPKILGILKSLGYMHDRQKGLDHLTECLASGTIRSSLASLFLLAFHGILPSFAALMAEESLPAAQKAVAATKALFPRSILHLWITGRVERLRRPEGEFPDLEAFQRCVHEGQNSSLARSLPQLKHFALYDLAWSYCAELRWEDARKCFATLEEESMWSKGFYAYAQGACLETLGKLPEASICYWRAITHKQLKLGGKVVSVDQFVTRRVKRMIAVGKRIQQELDARAEQHPQQQSVTGKEQSKKLREEASGGAFLLVNTTPFVPALELTMLFNMLPQMRHDKLVAAHHIVEDALQSKALRNAELRPPTTQDDFAKLAATAGDDSDAEDITSIDPRVNDLFFVSESDADVSAPASPTPMSAPGAPYDAAMMARHATARQRLNRRFNACIFEDKASLALMYATLTREIVRTRPTSTKGTESVTGAGDAESEALHGVTFEDALELFGKLVSTPNTASKGASGKGDVSSTGKLERLRKAISEKHLEHISRHGHHFHRRRQPQTSSTATTASTGPHMFDSNGLLVLPTFNISAFDQLCQETWLLPNVLYEKAVTLYLVDDLVGCKEIIKNTIRERCGGKDYNFEMIMQFRLHLSADALRHLKG